jgi:predicted RNase H-like HicB family nuclease
MKFTADLHLEDGSSWAEVREVPDCFASGDTLDELFEGLREAIRICLEHECAGRNLQIASAVLSSEPVPR